MASYDLKNLLEKIADAIRVKDRTIDKINAQDFPNRIRAIPQEARLLNANIKLFNEIDCPINVKIKVEIVKVEDDNNENNTK